ncbi:MAG: serine/threonine-protein kinase [Planctomycetota bacterium]
MIKKRREERPPLFQRLFRRDRSDKGSADSPISSSFPPSTERRKYRAGEKLGPYTILKTLSSGRIASDYLAEQPALGRRVVLETPTYIQDSTIARFHQAARLLAALNHPNIPRLYDVGEENGHPYMVMEHIEGRSLSSLSQKNDLPPLEVLLRLMAAIAGALQHAHENEVIHRNVKPGNILIAPNGEPVLIGFGSSAPTAGDPLMQKGGIIGTPAYMAPEQWSGEDLSPQVDIWGLGATMFQLLAGRRVLQFDDVSKMRAWMASPDPVNLQPLQGKAPEFVTTIVEKCLKKKPEERYPRADDARRSLEAAIDHIDRTETKTLEMELPRVGQTLLLYVEYQQSDMPGSYRAYEIQSWLGAGGYGDVFRAQEVLTKKEVALKILQPRWVPSDEAVARFRREATLLSRLSHPNIIEVHTFGRYGPSFFIAMELLKGPTLEQVILDQAPMSVETAFSLMAPILDGLVAIHDAEVVHRDLKPSNIALEFGRIVLFDFGMAYEQEMQKITLTGALIGSPPYMSPEQARGEVMTRASDIYSAGVLLYEMLTGKRPHEDESTHGLLRKIASQSPEPLKKLRPGTPQEVCEFLDALLAKAPEERPTSARGRQLLASLIET